MRNVLVLLLAAVALGAAGCGGGDDGEQVAGVTGDAFDRAFIDAMVPHHDSAIDAARAAKEAGLSQPDLIQIADDIIATQQIEIDQLLAWREQWFGSKDPGSEEAALDALGLSAAEAGMEHRDVDFASEPDVDQSFAEMMIDHHEGAIRIAKLAEESGGHDEIRQVAADIIAAQQREIDIMREHAEAQH